MRRAVEAIERALTADGGVLFCLNEIVHNRRVVKDLEDRGVVFVRGIQEVPVGACLVFSAHGVPPSAYKQASDRGLKVVDATCPFVSKVHAEVRRFAADGYRILLVGHRQHDEIVGVRGEAPDSVTVVESVEEAKAVAVGDPNRVAVVTQTTLSVDASMRVVSVLREHFPNLLLSPQANICHATSSRQTAVKELALCTERIFVIGSSNSSNSLRLVEVASEAGAEACLVESAAELAQFDLSKVESVGITAGASTPEVSVGEVLACLKEKGFGAVCALDASTEDVRFSSS